MILEIQFLSFFLTNSFEQFFNSFLPQPQIFRMRKLSDLVISVGIPWPLCDIILITLVQIQDGSFLNSCTMGPSK